MCKFVEVYNFTNKMNCSLNTKPQVKEEWWRQWQVLVLIIMV